MGAISLDHFFLGDIEMNFLLLIGHSLSFNMEEVSNIVVTLKAHLDCRDHYC